jgi:hypothetical protein
MIKKIYAAIVIAITFGSVAMAQTGTLKGKAIDETNGEGISFANVQLEQNGNAIGKTVADINGEFTIKPIPPGTYDVKVASIGYQTYFTKGVAIGSDKTAYVEAKVKSTAIEKDAVVITEYVKPLIDPDTKSGGTVTREEFQAMPSKNINSVASTTAGVFQQDEGGDINVRGGRTKQEGSKDYTGTVYFIDGEKVRGSIGLPQSSIEQVSVITGGLPAQYGDATGGIINITTRNGMVNEFYGNVELISSQVTDAFDYNFAGFTIGGPIVAKKDSTGYKQSKLGFSISGEVSSDKDPNPSAVGMYKVKDDKLKELEEKPIVIAESGTGSNLNASFLRMDDLEHVKAKQNVGLNSARLSGKIDFRASKNITFTVGGTVDYDNHREFTLDYALLNSNHNPQYIISTTRVWGKISHKLSREQNFQNDKSTSIIKNAYYTLQVGYTKYLETNQDDTQKNNLFNYGYVGKFETKKAPSFAPVTDATGKILYYNQVAVTDTQVLFRPGTQNPLTTNYTSQFYELVPGEPNTLSDISAGYGLINGERPRHVYSIWNNTGRLVNTYRNIDNTQLRASGQFSADIKNHAIQIGFEFEKRDDRNWTGNPIPMWTIMRQLANKHITQLNTKDSSLYTGSKILIGSTLVNPTANAYVHPYIVNTADQSYFDKSLRKALGKGANEWIDIDSYDPSTFNLSMFSADELINGGTTGNTVTYSGYSYDGKKLSGKTAFNLNALENYYKGTDANGSLTRVIPSYQPTYISGYIQDKFDIKDMKFNIGLRVDHFDANQPVLKDPYLFNEAKTVSEASKFKHPTSIPSSAIVYVDDAKNPSAVLGYRNGNVWYNALGVEIADPKIITPSSGTIQPYLKYPTEKFLTSSKVENVFEMYKAQNTFMPRIAFSFPISTEASFFAHYDVLSQRPPTGLRFDPSDYLFIQTVGAVVNNPALKPERTTDYELGFRQVLNERKNASLSLSAFYREMRDMIQQIQVVGAYPISYTTYGNIDFGTVKGFTLAYDLRRTNNVSLNASYTLQFADGTGSVATSAANIIKTGQPNLRTIMPLDYDQRHAIVLTTDYRFGEGKNYKGPQASWAKGIFENFGGNIVFRSASGLPYTRQKNVTSGNGDNTSAVVFGMNQRAYMKGKLNGSNLPWSYRADIRLDKNITLIWKKSEGEAKEKSSNLNVYVQILNVLNTKNIVNLYRFTGDPKDDGYLSAPENQGLIASALDSQSYRDLYEAKIANPNHYSIPRRIRVGILLDF